MDKGTLPDVVLVHRILPTVEDRLSLTIRVAHNDEDDPNQLPLCQFHPCVQLDFRPFVDDDDRPLLRCPTFAAVLVQVVSDGLAANQHGSAVP